MTTTLKPPSPDPIEIAGSPTPHLAELLATREIQAKPATARRIREELTRRLHITHRRTTGTCPQCHGEGKLRMQGTGDKIPCGRCRGMGRTTIWVARTEGSAAR